MNNDKQEENKQDNSKEANKKMQQTTNQQLSIDYISVEDIKNSFSGPISPSFSSIPTNSKSANISKTSIPECRKSSTSHTTLNINKNKHEENSNNFKKQNKKNVEPNLEFKSSNNKKDSINKNVQNTKVKEIEITIENIDDDQNLSQKSSKLKQPKNLSIKTTNLSIENPETIKGSNKKGVDQTKRSKRKMKQYVGSPSFNSSSLLGSNLQGSELTHSSNLYESTSTQSSNRNPRKFTGVSFGSTIDEKPHPLKNYLSTRKISRSISNKEKHSKRPSYIQVFENMFREHPKTNNEHYDNYSGSSQCDLQKQIIETSLISNTVTSHERFETSLNNQRKEANNDNVNIYNNTASDGGSKTKCLNITQNLQRSFKKTHKKNGDKILDKSLYHHKSRKLNFGNKNNKIKSMSSLFEEQPQYSQKSFDEEIDCKFGKEISCSGVSLLSFDQVRKKYGYNRYGIIILSFLLLFVMTTFLLLWTIWSIKTNVTLQNLSIQKALELNLKNKFSAKFLISHSVSYIKIIKLIVEKRNLTLIRNGKDNYDGKSLNHYNKLSENAKKQYRLSQRLFFKQPFVGIHNEHTYHEVFAFFVYNRQTHYLYFVYQNSGKPLNDKNRIKFKECSFLNSRTNKDEKSSNCPIDLRSLSIEDNSVCNSWNKFEIDLTSLFDKNDKNNVLFAAKLKSNKRNNLKHNIYSYIQCINDKNKQILFGIILHINMFNLNSKKDLRHKFMAHGLSFNDNSSLNLVIGNMSEQKNSLHDKIMRKISKNPQKFKINSNSWKFLMDNDMFVVSQFDNLFLGVNGPKILAVSSINIKSIESEVSLAQQLSFGYLIFGLICALYMAGKLGMLFELSKQESMHSSMASQNILDATKHQACFRSNDCIDSVDNEIDFPLMAELYRMRLLTSNNFYMKNETNNLDNTNNVQHTLNQKDNKIDNLLDSIEAEYENKNNLNLADKSAYSIDCDNLDDIKNFDRRSISEIFQDKTKTQNANTQEILQPNTSESIQTNTNKTETTILEQINLKGQFDKNEPQFSNLNKQRMSASRNTIEDSKQDYIKKFFSRLEEYFSHSQSQNKEKFHLKVIIFICAFLLICSLVAIFLSQFIISRTKIEQSTNDLVNLSYTRIMRSSKDFMCMSELVVDLIYEELLFSRGRLNLKQKYYDRDLKKLLIKKRNCARFDQKALNRILRKNIFNGGESIFIFTNNLTCNYKGNKNFLKRFKKFLFKECKIYRNYTFDKNLNKNKIFPSCSWWFFKLQRQELMLIKYQIINGQLIFVGISFENRRLNKYLAKLPLFGYNYSSISNFSRIFFINSEFRFLISSYSHYQNIDNDQNQNQKNENNLIKTDILTKHIADSNKKIIADEESSDYRYYLLQSVFSYNFNDPLNIINASSKYLRRLLNGNLSKIKKTTEIKRTIDEPLTFIAPIANDKRQFIIINLDREKFIGIFNKQVTLAFLLAAQFTFIILSGISVSFVKLRHQYYNIVSYQENFEYMFGMVDISRIGLYTLMKRIRHEVINSFEYSQRRKHPNKNLEPSLEFRSDVAVMHVKNACNGKNVLRFCLLNRPDLSLRPLQIYQILSNKFYEFFLFMFVVGHISLTIWEPISNSKLKKLKYTNQSLTFVELLCIIIEIVDLSSRLYIQYIESRLGERKILKRSNQNINQNISGNNSKNIVLQNKQELNQSKIFIDQVSLRSTSNNLLKNSNNINNIQDSTHNRISVDFTENYDSNEPIMLGSENFLTEPYSLSIYIIRLILHFLIFLDQFFKIAFKQSFQYNVPLRPFLIIIMSRRIRRSAATFVKTLYDAADIFALFFVFVMVSSLFGLMLFNGSINPNQVKSSYDNFVRAVISTFVYIVTGENYSELVHPAYQINKLYLFYFVILTLFGMFFMLGMVTGFFQEGFRFMQKIDLKRRKLYTRVGILSAFILLDRDNNGQINHSEFSKFLYGLKSDLNDSGINELFKILNKDNDDDLNAKEFVDGVEEISIRRLITSSKSSKYSFLSQTFLNNDHINYILYKSETQNQFIFFTILIDMLVLSLYGVQDSNQQIVYISFSFLLFYFLEILMRFFLTGPNHYWFYAHYFNPGLFQMFSNRIDLIVLLICLLTLSCRIFSKLKSGISPLQPDTFLLFCLCIPILRIFTQIRRLRYLLFTLFQLFPLFGSLFTLLIVIFFVYGIIGISSFSEKYEVLANGIPFANFDTFGQATVTLFQLLIGEGWHEIMYATILSTHFVSAQYFLSFMFLVNLLFTNLFIGLILSVFNVLISGENKNKELSFRELDQITEEM